MRADRTVCFRLDAAPAPPAATRFMLPPAQQAALAELLQVLACGEESAALAFAHLAGNAAARQALLQVAADERGHERLLRGMRLALPAPAADPALRRALMRFYHGLSDDKSGLHFASIVALDSAVCIILGALLAPRRPLAGEPAVAAVLSRIRGDEARHVRLTRDLAAPAAPAARERAAETRSGLVVLIARRAEAFDALQVDPDRLFRRLADVPAGLLP